MIGIIVFVLYFWCVTSNFITLVVYLKVIFVIVSKIVFKYYIYLKLWNLNYNSNSLNMEKYLRPTLLRLKENFVIANEAEKKISKRMNM